MSEQPLVQRIMLQFFLVFFQVVMSGDVSDIVGLNMLQWQVSNELLTGVRTVQLQL